MSNAAYTASSPDGLARIRRLLATGGCDPMGETLGFRLVKVDFGRVILEGVPGRNTYNPLGTVHGGYAATLLDSACGLATASSLRSDEAFATLELKVSYHKAMTEKTGPVRAEGIVLNKGRRVVSTEAKLMDRDHVLLASATSTLMVISV